MKIRKYVTKFFLLMFVAIVICAVSTQEVCSDEVEALHGVHNADTVFDIDVDPMYPCGLVSYLKAISDLHVDLEDRGLKTKFIVAFRGQSVVMVKDSSFDIPGIRDSFDYSPCINGLINGLIGLLKQQGAELQACEYAMANFGLQKDDMIIDTVENTFHSMIGYQKKGYTLIPVMPSWSAPDGACTALCP